VHGRVGAGWHRSVVRCLPWAGASRPGPRGREEVIKGTKVDLAVRQVYLNRGNLVQSASVAGFIDY